ncbi:hypothetical protein [Actinocatenispora rupis]|nr:hypothetical protein [Actinocatenispora rupis]
MTPDAVRELYRAPIEEFVATRDRLVRAARRSGDTELAGALAAARKPLLAAWLVNRLAADAPERVAALLELAERFRAAYAAGDAGQVRELSTERQRALAELVDLTGRYAEDSGRRATDAVLAQVGETLSAALVEPEIAARVRDGVVVRPERYSGLGPAMPAASPDVPGAERRLRSAGDRAEPVRKEKAAGAGRRAGAGRKAEAEAKPDRRAEAERARDEAAGKERETRQRLADLDATLTDLRDALREAMRARDRCARDHETARRALARAEQRLRNL